MKLNRNREFQIITQKILYNSQNLKKNSWNYREIGQVR